MENFWLRTRMAAVHKPLSPQFLWIRLWGKYGLQHKSLIHNFILPMLNFSAGKL